MRPIRVLLAGLVLATLAEAVASAPAGAQPGPQGGPRMIYPGMMGPGMMGPGMMGPGGGMMGPGPGGVPPQGQAASGAAIFQGQCAQCHALRPGAPPAPGPDLFGLFGRKAGSLPGYPYSPAMLHSGLTWNAASLDRFLAAPQSVVPGTVMPYPGLPDPEARRKLEAFLQAATK